MEQCWKSVPTVTGEKLLVKREMLNRILWMDNGKVGWIDR